MLTENFFVVIVFCVIRNAFDKHFNNVIEMFKYVTMVSKHSEKLYFEMVTVIACSIMVY